MDPTELIGRARSARQASPTTASILGAVLLLLAIGTTPLARLTLATRALPLSSPVGVVASTLAAAALFNPLRRRIQHIVDRHFNRARYDAEAVVATFTSHLRDAIDLDSVHSHLIDAVGKTLAPDRAWLWIRFRSREP